MNEVGSGNTSFGQAALAHLDALYGYALTLTRNQSAAEDLVQDTYLRAVRAFGQLVPNSNLKGWLFVIMRNAWLNQIRHRNSGPRFIELDEPQGKRAIHLAVPDDDPYLAYMRKLDREEIQAAIASLPGIYREIIVLRDIEGFSYQEIAQLISCPAGTVMSRLGRARGKLRRLLSGRLRAKAKAG